MANLSPIPRPRPDDDLIRVVCVMGLDRHVEKYATNPQAVFREFGIDTELLKDPDSYIAYSAYINLLEYCSDEFEVPFFGYELTKYQGIEKYGPVAVLARTSRTVGEALGSIAKYLVVIVPSGRCELNVDGGVANFSYAITPLGLKHKRQVNEVALMSMLSVLRSLVGEDYHPSSMCVAADDPGFAVNPLHSHVHCDMSYGHEKNQLLFPAQLLEQEISGYDSAMHTIAAGYLDSLVVEFERTSSDTPAEVVVNELIAKLLPYGRCNINTVADFMNKHPRTLQYELESQGLEFRQLLARQRFYIGKNYLRNTNLSLSDIAAELGYSDQSTFTRAFTRWAGVSPKKFRDKSEVASEQ